VTPRQQVEAAAKHARAAGVRVVFQPEWDSRRIAGKGTFEPRFVMLHHTAGTDSLAWLSTSKAYPYYPVRGANVLVDRDGTVRVLSASVAYHAGLGGPRWGVPAGRMNPQAWGIEIEDLGRGQTMTPEQRNATAWFVAGLLRAAGSGVDRVVQHREWNPTGKTDTRYPTEDWRAMIAERMNPPQPPPPAEPTEAEKIARAVWDAPVEDPVTGETVTMRRLLMRTRTNAKQAAEWSKPDGQPTDYDGPASDPPPAA
jgi:hypothetical protein